jgi:hypothetical protein
MTSPSSVEGPLDRTANLLHKDGTESALLHRGRSSVIVPTASSDSTEVRRQPHYTLHIHQHTPLEIRCTSS